jgi:hypothetical protein
MFEMATIEDLCNHVQVNEIHPGMINCSLYIYHSMIWYSSQPISVRVKFPSVRQHVNGTSKKDIIMWYFKNVELVS